MAATDKAQLLAITEKEFDKLSKLVDVIEADAAMEKAEYGISIKDVVAHRAYWIDLFLGWHADGLAGRIVHFPAKGYKWNDLKRYNSDLRARQAELDWPAAKAMLRTNYRKLKDFIEAGGEDDLYGGPMKGANNAWTTGRWAEAAGASHFRSASKYIRSIVKKQAGKIT